MLFLRWRNSWTSSPCPRARQRRRRRRKRQKPLNYRTQSSPTDSSLSLLEPSTSLAEMESHQPARRLPHPQTLHPLHGPDSQGSPQPSSRVKTPEVVPELRFRMGLMAGLKLRSDSVQRGKRETNTRIRHLPNEDSAGHHAWRLFFCIPYDMAKHTLNVLNTNHFHSSEAKRNAFDFIKTRSRTDVPAMDQRREPWKSGAVETLTLDVRIPVK